MGLPSTFPDPSFPVRHSTRNVEILGHWVSSYNVLLDIEVLEHGLNLFTACFLDVVSLSATGSYGHGDVVLLQVVHQLLDAGQERYIRP